MNYLYHKYLTNAKAWIILLFLFIPVIIFGQNTHEINLTITDTIIFVKKSTKRNRYAAKVNVEINVPNLHDTLFLDNFKKYVSAGFYSDIEPFNSVDYSVEGLNYIVENKYHSIIPVPFTLGGDITKIRGREKRIFVTSSLKIKFRPLNKEEPRNYDRAKYEITEEKQCLILYPLLSIHTYSRLSKGEYYLYFVYVFVPNPVFLGRVANDSSVFKGSFVSNKIKLIVE